MVSEPTIMEGSVKFVDGHATTRSDPSWEAAREFSQPVSRILRCLVTNLR